MSRPPGPGRTGLAAPALAGVAALAALVLAAVPAPGHEKGGVHGVVGVDLWAQGTTVDLLLAVAGPDGLELRHRRSRDGGESWAGERAVAVGAPGIAPVHRGSDPQIVASGDRLLAVWTAPGSSPWGTGPLAAAASADGGATWNPVPGPADDGGTGGHGYVDLAADAAGRFHAVWLDGREGTGQGLRAAVSTDGGRSWSANRTLDGQTCECCWNRLLADGGDLYALYRDRDPRDLAVAASRDAGASWKVLGAAGAFGWQFEGCPHVGGGLAATGAAGRRRLHALAWTGADEKAGLYAVTSADGGTTWTPPVRLPTERGHRGDLAAAGDRLVAVWDEPAEGGTAVYAAESVDSGRHWTAPKRLPAKGAKASQPLAVGTGDGVLAVWTEIPEPGGSAALGVRRIDPTTAAGPAR